eukprot:6183807-Pleurochrysis_carterae.AAC.3
MYDTLSRVKGARSGLSTPAGWLLSVGRQAMAAAMRARGNQKLGERSVELSASTHAARTQNKKLCMRPK